MITGSCHCGAIRWPARDWPQWLTRCTCSYCRRAGAHWGRTDVATVKLEYDAPPVRYIHGDRTQAFVACGTCGIVTHWESLPSQPEALIKLNFNTADTPVPDEIPVRTFDGADSWAYID